jgi:hypothetical protein
MASHLGAQHTSRLGRAKHSSAVQGWCAELSKIYLNSHTINVSLNGYPVPVYATGKQKIATREI